MLKKNYLAPWILLFVVASFSSTGWSQTESKELSRRQKFEAKLKEQMESRRQAYRERLRNVTQRMTGEPPLATINQFSIPTTPALQNNDDWGWRNDQRNPPFGLTGAVPRITIPHSMIRPNQNYQNQNALNHWGVQGQGIFIFPNPSLYRPPVFGRAVPRLNASDAIAVRSIINRDTTRQQNLNARFNPIMAGQIRADQLERDFLRLNRDLRRREKIEARLRQK